MAHRIWFNSTLCGNLCQTEHTTSVYCFCETTFVSVSVIRPICVFVQLSLSLVLFLPHAKGSSTFPLGNHMICLGISWFRIFDARHTANLFQVEAKVGSTMLVLLSILDMVQKHC